MCLSLLVCVLWVYRRMALILNVSPGSIDSLQRYNKSIVILSGAFCRERNTADFEWNWRYWGCTDAYFSLIMQIQDTKICPELSFDSIHYCDWTIQSFTLACCYWITKVKYNLDFLKATAFLLYVGLGFHMPSLNPGRWNFGQKFDFIRICASLHALK